MNDLLLTRDGKAILRLPFGAPTIRVGRSGDVDLLVEDEFVAPLQLELITTGRGMHRAVMRAGTDAISIEPMTTGSGFAIGPYVAHYRSRPPPFVDGEPSLDPFEDTEHGSSMTVEGFVMPNLAHLALVHGLVHPKLRNGWAIVGEAGTGKTRLVGLLARYLRASVAVEELDCATLAPDEVLAAVSSAGGRTALPSLLEAQRLPLAAQAALVEQLLSGHMAAFSFREPPKRHLAEGTISEELHDWLLNPHFMPPLRSDPERLPHFFERLLGLYSPGEPPKLHRSAVEALRRYRWPGNVRELCWTAQRILLRGAGPLLREDDLRLGAGQCPT